MSEQDVKKEELQMISAEEFAKGWDEERRVQDLDKLTLALRETTMYIPTRTKLDMDELMGGPTLAVRTRTFEDYRVWITPCKPDHPDARALRPTTDTHGAAELSFGVQLRKMGLKIPRTRTYVFGVKRIPAEGGGVVYEISFAEFKNKRRDLQAPAAAAKQAKGRRRAPKVVKPVEPAEPDAVESMDEEEEE